jgi:quercetin dioxygenase-like cupin family protein
MKEVQAVSTESYKANVDSIEPVPGLDPSGGWIKMTVQFLVDHEHGGAKQTVFGRALFPPGAEHESHRHPNAEEVVYLVRGHGIALNGDDEIELGPGDVAFHPRNEWHGFRNVSPTEEAEMIWAWVGASSKEEAGYVLRNPK